MSMGEKNKGNEPVIEFEDSESYSGANEGITQKDIILKQNRVSKLF